MHQTALYLSSLWDFPCSCLLLLRLFFISGFIDVPLPCNHGFYWLFDWPTVDLFVLPGGKVGSYCRQKNAGGARVRVTLPSRKRFCKVWAWDEFWHFHPAFHRMTSCSGSGMDQDDLLLLLTNLKSSLSWSLHICKPPTHGCSDHTLLFHIWSNKTTPTFSNAHLSCVYSAYLLIKASSLSGMMVLWLHVHKNIQCSA